MICDKNGKYVKDFFSENCFISGTFLEKKILRNLKSLGFASATLVKEQFKMSQKWLAKIF
jgi:hypothetical protein